MEIRKVSDETLVGSAPDITRYLIEVRGIGIIDVKTLFGVESVKDTQSIDMVIKLEEWERIRNTTVSDLRTSTRSSLEIKLSATTFRSVQDRLAEFCL